MRGVDHIEGALRVVQEPVAVTCRVVVNQVGDRGHLPVFSHVLHKFAEVAETVLRLAGGEDRVKLELVLERVGRVGFAKLLDGREVHHVVA